MLADVIDCLACPHCGGDLEISSRTLRCDKQHSFDVARQGYASLLPGDAHTGTADTAGMVAARASFLAAGHFDPIADAVAGAVAHSLDNVTGDGCIVDVGAGTGYYLTRTLERAPGRAGVALDVSKYALRRAAKAHPRVGAVACDVWCGLPLRTNSAAVIIDVFAPRNAAEFARVLTPDGALVVVTPTAEHLSELVDALGLLDVDASKAERLSTRLSAGFTLAGEERIERRLALTRREVAAVVAMGPSARHLDATDLGGRIAGLAEPIHTRLSVAISLYRSRV